MYPNQQYYQQGGGPSAPYPPQQPTYGGNMGPGGLQQNMSGPYQGTGNPYGSGAPGNPYNQGGFGGGNYPSNQGGYQGVNNPYNQSGPGISGNSYNQGGFGMGNFPSNQSNFGGGNFPNNQGRYGDGPASNFQGGFGRGGYPNNQGGFGSGPGMFMSNDLRAQRLNQVIQQHEVNPQFAARLQGLTNCEIVVLCDDSGSMNSPLQGTNQTRWDELKSIVGIVVDIASAVDSNGVDVYFLNRDPMVNVTNSQFVRQAFTMPPQGLTPLVPALRRILAAKREVAFQKRLLILIATDGEPTDLNGQPDIMSLQAVLSQERSPQTFVTFLACTDELQTVNYLANWDRMMPNLDVMDDYRSERAEIQRIRGPSFPFSFGDYIVKALLGSMDRWFDTLDERA